MEGEASALTPPTAHLPDAVAGLVDSTLEALRSSPVVDVHVHTIGMQPSVTGCCIHSSVFSWWHPVNKVKQAFFQSGLGIKSMGEDADRQMVARLVDLSTGIAGRLGPNGYRCVLLPFDAVYTKSGVLSEDQTAVYVPNTYVESIASQHPSIFTAACSVHPYREDALAELRRCRAAGTRVVKWLPNTQFIDPSSELCDGFYDELVRLDMVLLCHTGEEHSITFCGVDDSLGNPLRLRRALDRGVRVVLAHCGSEGSNPDLDLAPECPVTENFRLCIRLLHDARYKGRVFADISALPTFRRAHYILDLLRSPELHETLIYGSDYPVPCVPLVVRTKVLTRLGLMLEPDRVLLDTLFAHNPLLANLVLMRLVSCRAGVASQCPCFTVAVWPTFFDGTCSHKQKKKKKKKKKKLCVDTAGFFFFFFFFSSQSATAREFFKGRRTCESP
eukprot:NODE_231_length_2075_cov_70.153998_g129_i1.p1 GENE.NODE_231_length_2075_cov_70.153998_g129_i1~~NODE_231_length_2075_cov_70.153998_g129_i1.p1  ORF type:complete len:445 (-),score=131.18 NODE_231_length_2075_cov_70.153998_g129_i1:258-1592(-)